jgi:hypothetical protein
MPLVEAIGRCMICREPCFPHVWLCQSCYDQWPELRGPFEGWPEWAQAAKRMHQSERDQERDILENEIETPVDLPEFLEARDDGQDDE